MPLELVHSDVWGPARTSSGGYKYYVSFVDDYSRFCWIYLLKHKSDVEEVFYAFQAHVERLLNAKIKAVQSDGGGEYQKLGRYFQRTGISHRVSCPHTSQQNGVAERKHRHLVETGLALLAHSSLPLHYWDEAFLTACYLINRMPTPVINKETPLYRLLHVQPNYSFLRIFGCTCWPSLRKYNSHKLDFRSKACVFLGYSPMHKGYKCLDRSTGRIYISRDVVFDETVFPSSTPSVTVDVSALAESITFPNNELVTSEPMRKYDLSYLSTYLPMPDTVKFLQAPAIADDPVDTQQVAAAPVRPMDVHVDDLMDVHAGTIHVHAGDDVHASDLASHEHAHGPLGSSQLETTSPGQPVPPAAGPLPAATPSAAPSAPAAAAPTHTMVTRLQDHTLQEKEFKDGTVRYDP